MCRLVLVFTVSFLVYICDSSLVNNITRSQDEPFKKFCTKNEIYSSDSEIYSIDKIIYPVKGGELKFHFIPETWQKANLRCQNEGSDLASPLNEELLSTMVDVMQHSSLCRVFTGISAITASGDYETVDGVPLEKISLKWMPKEPDNLNDQERCLAVSSQGAMADVRCDHPLPYFCFKKYNDSHYDCGSEDDGYKQDTRTGHCYKLHQFGKTWPRAKSTCEREGAQLAIINSDTEAQVLKEIIESNPQETLHADNTDYFVVGYRKVGDVWMTLDEDTLKEAGYERWAPNEPNNMTSPELCGSITREAKLNDIPCTWRYTFICEKA